ncbi:hotdog fold domain-containing protein [Mycolicibacterium conceptionense]|uniref:hotdog fold domain-containing protein n=1 Tax=Mycolicibacterium conceptionense TaxID=451644 RepID=UPI00399AAE09
MGELGRNVGPTELADAVSAVGGNGACGAFGGHGVLLAKTRQRLSANHVFVYNHLHTVHAIASCNAAEMAMGMLMEATVPTTHRWIPKAMNVQYLAKATTSLRARAELDPPDFGAVTQGTDIVVPVSITDRHGVEVVHADITTWVTPV